MNLNLSQALQAYQASSFTSAPASQSDASTIGNFSTNFEQTLARSEEAAFEAMVGTADPHSLVEAVANSQLAIETAVTVRDRIVEAYQEILRMPV